MMKQNCCAICKVVGLLVIIGALNWGIIGALKINVVHNLIGSIPKAERIVYILVGLAGIMKLISCFKECPACKK